VEFQHHFVAAVYTQIKDMLVLLSWTWIPHFQLLFSTCVQNYGFVLSHPHITCRRSCCPSQNIL